MPIFQLHLVSLGFIRYISMFLSHPIFLQSRSVQIWSGPKTGGKLFRSVWKLESQRGYRLRPGWRCLLFFDKELPVIKRFCIPLIGSWSFSEIGALVFRHFQAITRWFSVFRKQNSAFDVSSVFAIFVFLDKVFIFSITNCNELQDFLRCFPVSAKILYCGSTRVLKQWYVNWLAVFPMKLRGEIKTVTTSFGSKAWLLENLTFDSVNLQDENCQKLTSYGKVLRHCFSRVGPKWLCVESLGNPFYPLLNFKAVSIRFDSIFLFFDSISIDFVAIFWKQIVYKS